MFDCRPRCLQAATHDVDSLVVELQYAFEAQPIRMQCLAIATKDPSVVNAPVLKFVVRQKRRFRILADQGSSLKPV